MIRWNAPQEVVDAARAAKETSKEFAVWPDNWKVLRAFLASSTQWRAIAGMAGAARTGFDYTGVRAGLKMANIKLKPAEWADFRHMEEAALIALNEREE